MKTKSDFQVGEVISFIRWEGPFISTYKGGRKKKANNQQQRKAQAPHIV